MKNNFEIGAIVTYALGVVAMWTYLIAAAIATDSDLVGSAIFAGWVGGLVWPLIVLVKLWLYFWF